MSLESRSAAVFVFRDNDAPSKLEQAQLVVCVLSTS